METEQLKALSRSETGKCPARRLRSQGMIPAILYGPRTSPMKLAVNAGELKKILVTKGDKKFFRLSIEEDGKTTDKLSIVKKFETHPLGGHLIHADFYEISLDQKITVDVPIHLKGLAQGVDLGGELQQHRRSLKISCLPDLLPESLEIDITRLNIGESMKVKDLQLAEGITVLDGEDVAVAFIASTRASMKGTDDQPGSGAAAQPEVLKQKAPEKQAATKKK